MSLPPIVLKRSTRVLSQQGSFDEREIKVHQQHGNLATQGFRELTLPSFVETVRLKYTLT